MPRPKETYHVHRCLSARSNREASESQPPSPPGVFSRTGPFHSSKINGSVRRPVLFWEVGLNGGGQSGAVGGKLILGRAEYRTGILHLQKRHEAITAHRLEVLERQPQRHGFALPHT